jgi:hypothetical protein
MTVSGVCSRYRRERPPKPPRLGRWQQVLADALDQNLAIGIQAAVADHLGRAPAQAELTGARRAAPIVSPPSVGNRRRIIASHTTLARMPPEGNLVRPASRPPEELLRSLGGKEDVDEVRTRFGAFLSEKVSPGAFERDRGGTPFSRELLREAGRLGLFGFTVPAEVGGQGRNWRDWGLVLLELCYQWTDTAFPMLLAYCGTSPSCSGRRSAPTSSTATCSRWRAESASAASPGARATTPSRSPPR